MRWPETETEWSIAVLSWCLGVVLGVVLLLLVDWLV